MLALVSVSLENRLHEHRYYIPLVKVDPLTENRLKFGSDQLILTSTDSRMLVVIDVDSIEFQVGFPACIDTSYFKVVSKENIFRDELLTLAAGSINSFTHNN